MACRSLNGAAWIVFHYDRHVGSGVTSVGVPSIPNAFRLLVLAHVGLWLESWHLAFTVSVF